MLSFSQAPSAGAQLRIAGDHGNRRNSPQPSTPDNVFFPGVAVLILAAVFLGFARTYYLAGVFRAPLPNLLVHIHGAVFSSGFFC